MKKLLATGLVIICLFVSALPVCATYYDYSYPGYVYGNYATYPVLRQGDTGPFVESVQRIISSEGFTCTIDGNFGSQTLTQVKRFQTANGLTSDGIVGRRTWEVLGFYS